MSSQLLLWQELRVKGGHLSIGKVFGPRKMQRREQYGRVQLFRQLFGRQVRRGERGAENGSNFDKIVLYHRHNCGDIFLHFISSIRHSFTFD